MDIDSLFDSLCIFSLFCSVQFQGTKDEASPSLSPPPSSITSMSRSETSVSSESHSRASSPGTPGLDRYRTRGIATSVPVVSQAQTLPLQKPEYRRTAPSVSMQRPPVMTQQNPVTVQGQFWYQPQGANAVNAVNPMMPRTNQMSQYGANMVPQQQMFFGHNPNAQYQGQPPQQQQQASYGHNGFINRFQQSRHGAFGPNGRFPPNGHY